MMFRIFGFLIGSAAAIGVILWVLGIPEFGFADQQESAERFEAALDRLKAKQVDAKIVSKDLSNDVVAAVEEVQDSIEAAAEDLLTSPDNTVVGETLSAQAEADSPTALPTDLAADSGDETIDDQVPLIESDPQWYSFWNPFRSEIAANGFVAQLERVTGLDYRVVKVKAGVYEVAFAYEDDVERRTKLSQISASTGLELPQQ